MTSSVLVNFRLLEYLEMLHYFLNSARTARTVRASLFMSLLLLQYLDWHFAIGVCTLGQSANPRVLQFRHPDVGVRDRYI